MDLAAAISYEGESVAMLFGTADRAAGLAAFRERRPPSSPGTDRRHEPPSVRDQKDLLAERAVVRHRR
jgi:hypothetical protein